MSLGIKHHILDFEILETGNPKTLVFLDSSEYYEAPERPLLEVTLPGHNKYFLVNVVSGKVNTFNSNTIGITQSLRLTELMHLPDGVYTLKYKVCPYDKLFLQKYYLRTVELDKKLDAVLVSAAKSDACYERDSQFNKEIIEIMVLIRTAKAHAADGDYRKASTTYQIAEKIVSRLYNKIQNIC